MGKQVKQRNYRLSNSVTHLLHRAQQAAVTQSVLELADQGLTIRQFAVLAALHEVDGQSQADLVEETGIDRSTLADMVSRMEKSGLLERTQSEEDARAKSVSLSASGLKAFEAAAPIVMEADEILLEDLRKSRRASLMESLAHIAGEEEEEEPRKKVKKKKKKKKS